MIEPATPAPTTTTSYVVSAAVLGSVPVAAPSGKITGMSRSRWCEPVRCSRIRYAVACGNTQKCVLDRAKLLPDCLLPLRDWPSSSVDLRRRLGVRDRPETLKGDSILRNGAQQPAGEDSDRTLLTVDAGEPVEGLVTNG